MVTNTILTSNQNQANDKKIITVTGFAHLITHFIVLIFPALVMPLSREFSITPGQVISMGFLLYLFYGLFAIPWGLLSNKINSKTIIALGLLLSGIGLILTAISPSHWLIRISLLLVGIGTSAYHPVGLGLLSKGVKKRGKALGINGLLGNIGIALAPIVSGICVYFINWRTYLLILGLLTLIISIIYFVIKLEIDNEIDQQKTTLSKKTKTAHIFVFIMIGMFFAGLLYRGFTVMLPAFTENKLTALIKMLNTSFFAKISNSILSGNFNTLIATVVASLIYLIAIFGQIVGGIVADKYDLRISYFFYYVIGLHFLIGMIFVSGWTFIILAGMFAFFTLGIQPIENSFIAMVTPPKFRSLSYGIKFTITFGGGSLAVFLIRFVEKKYDFMRASFLLPIFLLLVLLNIIVILIFSRGKEFKHKND